MARPAFLVVSFRRNLAVKAHHIASVFVLTAVLAVAQGAYIPDALVLSIRPVDVVGASSVMKSNRMAVRAEPGSESDPLLDETVPEFTLKDAIFVDGVSALSLKVRGHIGLEEIIREKIMDPRDRRIQFSLHLENKSVREILDTLCESDARYTWSVDGETINIYPRTATGDSSYLFNLELDKVMLEAVTDPDHALTPSVRELHNQQIGYMGVGGDDKYPAPWTISFENLSVRQFTNRITEHMGEHTSWIWQGGRDERMFTFLKGGFHTESGTSEDASTPIKQ